MKLLYIIGEPGAGKSTVVRNLLGEDGKNLRWDGDERLKLYVTPKWISLGWVRMLHGGTSSLPATADAQELAYRWMKEERPPFVLGEGNKLIRKDWFFEQVLELGYKIVFVYLKVSRTTASARRKERGLKSAPGSGNRVRYGNPDPDQRWVTEPLGNIERIRSDVRWTVHTIDANRSAATVAADVRQIMEAM